MRESQITQLKNLFENRRNAPVGQSPSNPHAAPHSRPNWAKKCYPPKLENEVFRLDIITPTGGLNEKLKGKDILTVQDFLKALNKNEYELCEILGMRPHHKRWKNITNHARQCQLDNK